MNGKTTIIAEKEDTGIRIDTFIASKADDLSRSQVQKLIDDSNIYINNKNIKSNYKVREGDVIEINIPKPINLQISPEDIDIEILYEDNDIAVVNKPQGMVVHPAAGNYSGTLVNALLSKCSNLSGINGVIRPGIVHRIDKDTSGVLVIAKNDAAHRSLAEQIKQHSVKRVYIALVEGKVKNDTGTIDLPIGRHHTERKKMAVVKAGGRNAVTHYKVLERYKDNTLIEARLETGRTHQIRVHMAYIGLPLVGDPVYGYKKQRFNLKGQALHAQILGFIHPAKGEYIEFSAPLPQYFSDIINILGNEKNKA
jgi:23S rRNA pseudouridine1911/1915/1917 synthase